MIGSLRLWLQKSQTCLAVSPEGARPADLEAHVIRIERQEYRPPPALLQLLAECLPSTSAPTTSDPTPSACQCQDEPPPQHEDAHWELVAETDDQDLAIRVFEKLRAKLRRRKQPTSQEAPGAT